MNSFAAVALLACVAVAAATGVVPAATTVVQSPLTYTGHPSYVLPRLVSPGYISADYVKPAEVIKPVDVKAGIVPSTLTYGSPVVYNSGLYPYSYPVSSYPYNYPLYGYNYKI